MTSLVPYPSSEEDDSEGEEKKEKRRLVAFDDSRRVVAKAGSTTAVQTSLGMSATGPLKGDWLCYAYVPIVKEGQVCKVMREACKLLTSQLGRKVKIVDEPHISLTKPVVVRFHEKQQVVTKAREAVVQSDTTMRFPLAFSAFTHLPSEDHTRIFWAVEVGLGWQELHSLTLSLNGKLATLHAREYFKEARFHSSFACISSDSLSAQQITDLSTQLEAQLGEQIRACEAQLVDKIGVATGLDRHFINLNGSI